MYEVNHLYRVEYVTPYTRDYFLVKALTYESVRTWALDNLYDFLDENEDDAFQEYKESGESEEGVEFYDSGTYQRYLDGSDFEVKVIPEIEYAEYIQDSDKPIRFVDSEGKSFI